MKPPALTINLGQQTIPDAELDRRFDLHRPSTPEAGDACQEIRSATKALAALIVAKTPAGREQAQAVAGLEIVLSQAIAAIVRP